MSVTLRDDGCTGGASSDGNSDGGEKSGASSTTVKTVTNCIGHHWRLWTVRVMGTIAVRVIVGKYDDTPMTTTVMVLANSNGFGWT